MSPSYDRQALLRTRTQSFHQQRIWIDRHTLPPLFLGAKLEDGQMKMRRVRVGISGCADVADDVACMHEHAFFDVVRVVVKMRVIVAITFSGIELIDRITTGSADKELLDHSVVDGKHWRTPR